MIHQSPTWDHPRGFAALAATAEHAAAEGRPVVAWSKQPLEGFESDPIADLAARFNLLVLDHPHIGEAGQWPFRRLKPGGCAAGPNRL